MKIKKQYEVRAHINDVGGSIARFGRFDTLDEAREVANELARDPNILCDPLAPWAVEVDGNGKEIIKTVDGERRLIIHELI